VLSDGTVFHYTQSNVAILGIRLLMGVIPALFVTLSLIFILQYPFTKEKTLEMKAMLAEIHKKKFGNLRADT
jgi:Na+/melibiose symporter-like transporter